MSEQKNVRKVGFIWSEVGLHHDTGAGHPERAERLVAVKEAFHGEGIEPSAITLARAAHEDLLRVHTKQHVDAIEHTCLKGTHYPDPDTVMVWASWEAALLAAGGAIAACKEVVEGRHDAVFSAMRPPGHHAESDRAMGFCLFNNVAVAARWLQAEVGVKKVAILDWDVHHGNGTQHSFYSDDSVYYVSLHGSPLYPGTGHANERGQNNTNLNVPMPPSSGPDDWLEAVARKVVPELEHFQPDFLLISAGFDGHFADPLGNQKLEPETYAEMTRMVRHLADGKIVSLLEGGYDLEGLANSALAHFKALEG